MSKLIVVVDDSPTIRIVDKICLEREGYQVQIFADGISFFHWLVATRTIPDLVLLDLLLPGMGGFEVARQFKAKPCYAPCNIIIQTRCDGLFNLLIARLVGAKGYIVKPAMMQHLLATVQDVIGAANDGTLS